jgi:TPR repeat protein
MDLPSPRAGEVPPALSPLDAFAMQSRLLARRFEQESQSGRRISRLPPVMVAKEMGNRPGYFRSLSNDSRMSDVAEGEGEEHNADLSQRGLTTRPAHDKDRPASHYPTFDRASGVPVPENNATPFYDAAEHISSNKNSPSYFGIPRASSPEPVDPKLVNVQAPSPAVPSLTSSIDTISSHPRTRTNDSQRSQRSVNSDRGGLAPPQSPRYPRSPRSFQSIRSVPPDSGDEDGQSAGGSNHVPSARKFSGSSNMSRPQSPFSPWQQPAHRSPSMTSEYSMSGSHHPQRPSGNYNNFSRPMSSSGSRPSFDTRPSVDSRPSLEARPGIPHRQPSGASNNSSTYLSSKPTLSRSGSGDDVETPHFGGMQTPNAENFQFPPNVPPGGDTSASYIYAKYALPRGRPVERDSTAFRDSWIQKQFEWDRQHDKSHPQHSQHQRNQSDSPLIEAVVRPSPSATDVSRTGRNLAPAPSAARSHSADARGPERSKAVHRPSASVKTESTDRTIKASPLHQKSASADLTPEEHLDIGIEAHDSGATTKSTYHLRLAAIAGLPTGMLLYALACRHGWGMRPNQEEGVKWLRKAIDIVGLDVADAEEKLTGAIRKSQMKMNPATEVAERKKRKAQYALAIYELGNSSMNGWGCPKDKALAVRCYEIAGAWGDMDALAEAGFCYTSGVGCKKDLKKAAALYRKAAKGGMSMAGNSW